MDSATARVIMERSENDTTPTASAGSGARPSSPRNVDDRSSRVGETSLEELRPKLERAIYRVCPAWMSDRRDDLVQVAMIKMMEAQRKSSEGIIPTSSSYLFRVAHNALVDEIRRHRRKRESPLEEGDETVEQRDEHDPERDALSRQTGRAIKDCLSRIKRERRMAVTLYLQGHSVPESSQHLGWSRKRTENLVFRGLDNLRQCLRKKGIEP